MCKMYQKGSGGYFSLECEATREIIGIVELRLQKEMHLTRKENCQFQKESNTIR